MLDEVESAEKDPDNIIEVDNLDGKLDEIDKYEGQDDGEDNLKENGNYEADPGNILAI